MTATCHDQAPDAPAVGADVALVGAPNAGKSSVFNHLTGLRVKTANYPGVTVTRASGRIEPTVGTGSEGSGVTLTDLPGTYGLTPVSPDEQVVADHLAGRLPGAHAPDALVLVVDATTLRRSLSLVAQAAASGRPCAVALTMVDELRSRGGDVDAESLARALDMPVREVVGHRGRGIAALREAILAWRTWPLPVVPPPADDEEQLAAWTDSVLAAAGYRAGSLPRTSRGIDRVLLHPVAGVLTFGLVMAAFFQTIFVVAAPLQGLVEQAFAALAGAAADAITQPLLADFVGTALIGGVGGVLVFLPQIALLFVLLALLEGSGYLARAAVLMDRVMAVTGLDGRAFVSMLSSVACAIPGIMSTRTMPSSRDRLATMMAAPLMPCSARLPVYLLLVGMLVPAGATWGPFGAQGLVLFGLYLLGGLSTLVAAAVLTRTALRGGGLPFYLELPPYRMPSGRTVLRTVGAAVGAFLRKMATVILVATVVLWALISFPARPDRDRRDATGRGLRVRAGPQLGRVDRPRGGAGVRAARLRLADRRGPDRRDGRPRGVRLDDGPGGRGPGPREPERCARGADLERRRAGRRATVHRADDRRPAGVLRVRPAVLRDHRGDAPRVQLVALARTRVRVHGHPGVAHGMGRADRGRGGARMTAPATHPAAVEHGAVPVHPERTAEPGTVLWRFGAGHGGAGPGWQGALDDAFAPLTASAVVTDVTALAGAVRVTLAPGLAWADHAAAVRDAAQRAALACAAGAPPDPEARREALERAARDALETAVGPYAAGHGGGIDLLHVGSDTVTVRLTGTCHGCPAAALTVHARLEGLIRRRAPWLDRVEVDGAQPNRWLDRTA